MTDELGIIWKEVIMDWLSSTPVLAALSEENHTEPQSV
jgi:hypothetical protein